MAAIPERASGTAHAIYKLHADRAAKETARPYLGWSQIGEPCERQLWYSFRWAESGRLDGRIARLFQTGHMEESRLLQELRDIGCTVYDRDEHGRQFGVSSVGGHFRGHADAVVVGLPEAPATPHLVDVKTIKAKKFDELLKKGMRDLYPKYWAQAHGYAGHMGLTRCMFLFVCKDDDRLHAERFDYDPQVFKRFEERAARIVKSTTPPPRISEDPAWFECKFCSYQRSCHGAEAPAVNCRTCAHSTPALDGDGTWRCEKYRCDLPVDMQRAGCADHRYIPALLEHLGDATGVEGDDVIYLMRDGKSVFVNGTPPAGFTSDEIRATGAGAPKVLADKFVRQIREEFPTARVVPSIDPADAPERMATVFDDMEDDIPY